jgi:hypothetical protein
MKFLGAGVLATALAALALVGCSTPVQPRTAASASPAGVATPTTPPATAIAAATPPRTTRANWPSDRATATDIVSRFRSAGLQVDAQPAPSSVVFGAERVDLYLVGGQTAAIYTFASPVASGRVLDDAANGRLTLSYLRTPYFVQAANLLVVITTDDSDAAGVLIGAIKKT